MKTTLKYTNLQKYFFKAASPHTHRRDKRPRSTCASQSRMKNERTSKFIYFVVKLSYRIINDDVLQASVE